MRVSGRKAFMEEMFRMTPAFSCAMNLSKYLAGQDRSHQVQIQNTLQNLVGQIEESPLRGSGGQRFVASRAVDEDVYATELFRTNCAAVSRLLLSSTLQASADGLPAAGRDLGGQGSRLPWH